jgi:hypothetical protein
MKRVSHRCFLHNTIINCVIGEEQFEIGTITMELSYKQPRNTYGAFLLSPRSSNRLYNKISGHFGVKLTDISLIYQTIVDEDECSFKIPHSCIITSNLRAERRNKLKVLIGY